MFFKDKRQDGIFTDGKQKKKVQLESNSSAGEGLLLSCCFTVTEFPYTAFLNFSNVINNR